MGRIVVTEFISLDGVIEDPGGDVADEVARLRDGVDGEILVAGCAQLVQALLEHDLVDELRLRVFPVVLGDGKRLFGPTSDKKTLRAVRTQELGDGVTLAVYEPVR